VPNIDGHCDERFARVASALERQLTRGEDVGASVAVALHGELVVDLWGGFADGARVTPWRRDSITNVMSTTKTMVALSALVLVDTGDLDLDGRVATYWPEFAQAGKREIRVRDVLGHTAGLPAFDHDLEPSDLADWERCTSTLAAQAPRWEPWTKPGYHALTQGFLIGEVIRRITGTSVGALFRSELAEPLGGAEFWIGLPAALDDRVAPLLPAPGEPTSPPPDAPELAVRAQYNPIVSAAATSEAFWRRAEVPAANGHGNARGVATVQALVSNRGEALGRRLLSERAVSAIFTEQANGRDLVLLVPVRWGIGYGLASGSMPIGPRACQWGGHGGSVVFSDQDSGLTVAYVMNQMRIGRDSRGAAIIAAAKTSIEPRWRRAARTGRRAGRAIRRRIRP
jgi:CubicO group peptidase (beta-lactamase class C family)